MLATLFLLVSLAQTGGPYTPGKIALGPYLNLARLEREDPGWKGLAFTIPSQF